jgi:hypothetical protein
MVNNEVNWSKNQFTSFRENLFEAEALIQGMVCLDRFSPERKRDDRLPGPRLIQLTYVMQ